jgi:WD40 repeat protein
MAIEVETVISNFARPITALDLSPEGDKLVLAHPGLRGAPGRLAIWHARREELLLDSPSASHSGLFGARFARNARTVIYGALDSRQVYEFDTLSASRRKLELEVPNPRWISVGNQGKWLCVCGDIPRVYDLAKQEFMLANALPERPSPDGKPSGLVCVSDDGTRLLFQMAAPAQILLLNAQTGRVLRRLTGTPPDLQALAMDPKSRFAAAIEYETRGTFLWDLETGNPHLPELFNARMTHNWCLKFSPTEPRIAIGMTTGFVFSVNVNTGTIEFERKLHEGRVWDLAFSRDGQELYSAGEDGAVCRVHFSAGESTALGIEKPGFE